MRTEIDALLPLVRTVLAVAETEHVTDAAHLLGVPQPTVSRHLARAAAALGVDLVERRGRGIALTPAGHVLVPYLARAVREIETGLEAMADEDARVRGRVAIAFQNTLGERVVPRLIERFRRDRSGVTVELDQGARDRCLARLDRGESDVAFVALGDEHRDRSTELFSERLVLVVPAGHRLADRPDVPRAVTDVADEPWVTMAHGYGIRSVHEVLWRAAGSTPAIAFQGQDIHTVRGLVGAGLGVSVLPPEARPSEPVQAHTVDLPLSDAHAERRIGMVWSDRVLPPQAAEFRDLVISEGRAVLR
ncbi:LysR family transcriptional regulator [Rhodococcus kroppenstedtii]|uniref:LysR family transcriptional regulator n=1 Tax=Rhodococcoides kroppenstedtii TaxID=293050 RepID=UPI001C9B3301|nr:LysR family transcriptional regulator [Rhodococcus kroppenstedtii]MBY6435877.1 LysR family transcriptional regulator [Rhodococcus kroppenstedtii]